MTSPPARPQITSQLRIVVPRYGENVVGGAERAMRLLAHALARNGWTIEVLTTTAVDESTWDEALEPGTFADGPAITVRRFPVRSGRRRWLFRLLSRWIFRVPGFLRPERLWVLLQGPYAPSLIRALSLGPAMPTLFSPYLFHPVLEGLPAAAPPRILCPAAHDEPPLHLNIVDRALRTTDGLWFHSPEEAELLRRVHPRARRIPSECGVVGMEPPVGVNAASFALARGIHDRYFFYGGRIAGGKGLADLLAGFSLIQAEDRSARLVISGEAAALPALPGVLTVGRLEERERWEAIAAAYAVIVPGRLESLSLLALEAWVAGRPCIVNAESAVLRGHVERGGGGLAYSGPAGLAAAALELLRNPVRAAELGARGSRYVAATYRWDLAEERLRRLIAATGA